MQFYVTQEKGTEPPYTGEYNNHFEQGTYYCVVCSSALFSSNKKFNAGCGWPSYYAPIDSKAIKYLEDNSHGMRRVETQCANCSAHLGHVFDDVPSEKGKRYCINSNSLDFKKD